MFFGGGHYYKFAFGSSYFIYITYVKVEEIFLFTSNCIVPLN